MNKQRLLERLEQIAGEVSRREGALALLALGSVGQDTDRLDQYSDLDFFLIVEAGYKQQFIDKLDWLSAIRPLGFSFQNTIDGHKALFDDGVFCEFAIFEAAELRTIPYSRGRVVWQRADFDSQHLEPETPAPGFGESEPEFLLGELLTNLYVGLGRYLRGEKLSACFFVQHHAAVRLIALIELLEQPEAGGRDSFSNERRFEQHFPEHTSLIEEITSGYHDTPLAARRMLEFVATHTQPNEAIVAEIEKLLSLCSDATRP